ncbi:hypothetical protein [Klebsiella phage Kpn74]|uniref:Uncharacterized protein n=1 Tax=Klebsiella phage Kpn74 TaxID=3044026 RepID=A0AAT9V565_9CAUD|nr:hypothetical protein [Klebsiella phage Kpn74]
MITPHCCSWIKNLDGTEVRRSWPAGGYPGSVCGARRYPSG